MTSLQDNHIEQYDVLLCQKNYNQYAYSLLNIITFFLFL
jgi:hypothetical protein